MKVKKTKMAVGDAVPLIARLVRVRTAVQQRPVNMDTTQVVQLINEINDIIVDAHGNFLFIIFSGDTIRIGFVDDGKHTIFIQNKEVIRILSEELANLHY